nr:low-density lipoprotein receptor-related protein 1-like isoform X2 [Procambarus clarkii]
MVEITRCVALALFLVGLQATHAMLNAPGRDSGRGGGGGPPWRDSLALNIIPNTRRSPYVPSATPLVRTRSTHADDSLKRTPLAITSVEKISEPLSWSTSNAANHIASRRRALDGSKSTKKDKDVGDSVSTQTRNQTTFPRSDVASPRPSVCDKRRMFQCLNGECISRNFWCDGSPDCLDFSDEHNCTMNGLCKNYQFSCTKSSNCIPATWRCDGEADCNDGSDEHNCTTTTTCLKHQFLCRGGSCISANLVCDYEKDCPEGDDEEQCGKVKCLSNPGHFTCLSGDCISPEETCDGRRDCDDGSDEGGRCDDRCKDGDCSHQCYMTPRGPHCVCPSGLTLRSSGICEDVDECRGNVSLCDHFCINVQGGYHCDCHQMYNLQSDNASCVARNDAPALLFFAQDKGVRVINVRNTFYREIIEGNDMIIGLALNPIDETLFFSAGDGIHKVSMKREEVPKLVINNGIGIGEGLAVDWLGGNLYLTDPNNGQILACSLDGVLCYVVVEDRKHPRGIQLDMRNRYMYWSDVESSLIEKAGMDGSRQTVLVSKGITWPNAIALDQPAGRLYWLDAREDAAYSIRTDGTDRKQLVDAAVNHPYALGVWNQYLYWTDWNHDHIRSCLKRNGKHVETVLKGSTEHDYFGLVVFHPDMLNQGTNPCRDHPCSSLCLLSPTSASEYICACPSYTMKLGSDKRTCVEEEDLTATLVATDDKIYKINHQVYGRNTLSPWRHDLKFHTIGSLDYEPTLGMVVVSDLYKEMIYGISDGVTAVLVNNSKAVGLAVDWLRGNLYWLNGKMGVEMGRLRQRSLEHRTLLVSKLSFPSDIAVAPVLGYIFISGSTYDKYIMRCGLDGSNCNKIIATDLNTPVSLAFDRDPMIERLYWCDYGRGTVESVEADGSKRILVAPSMNPDFGSPVDIIATSLNLMWSVEKSVVIFSAAKVNAENKKFVSLDLDQAPARGLRMTEIGWKPQASINAESYGCRHNNGNCTHLCAGNEAVDKVCLCESGHDLASDKVTCNPLNCSGTLYLCPGTKQCIASSWRCDGTRDCVDGADEKGCDKEEQCEAGKFRCSSGACIDESWTCDGVSDCPNGNDESLAKCSNKTCSENQFRCSSGQCIPLSWVCDHREECRDGSDERNCPTSCSDHQFTCRTGNCIPFNWRCDKDTDCNDGSDEEGCPETCGTWEFQCDNKRCVALSTTCDGDDDCGDGSDERLHRCSTLRSTAEPVAEPCPSNMIACLPNYADKEIVCIFHSDECNGKEDCPLGEDEICWECHETEFHCHSHRCIPKGFLCDGEDDCGDGSDEGPDANCTVLRNQFITQAPITTIELYSIEADLPENIVCSGMFQCLNGDCVPKEKLCNNVSDCFDSSDEGVFCDNHCANNGGCQHVCHPSPTGSYCSCHLGSHLGKNGKECLDDAVCEEDYCSHVCVKLRRQTFCSCAPGYNLQADNRTCKPNNGEEFVVLARPGGLVMVGHNFHIKGKADTSLNLAIDTFVVDPVNDMIIYTDKRRGVIALEPFMLGKAASNMKSRILLDKRSNPKGLSYDPIAKNIYFSEYFSGQLASWEGSKIVERSTKSSLKVKGHSMIMMCDISSKCSIVTNAPGQTIPSTSLAVRSRLLFSCRNSIDPKDEKAQIVSTFVDGSGMRVVREHKVVRCGSVAVDEIKTRVYWTDLALSTVESVAWDGSRHRLVQKDRVYSPVGLTLMGDTVIWINSKRRNLVRCSKYDVSDCEIKELTSDGSGVFSVLPLVGAGPNQCKSSSCKHLCTAYNDTAKCVCPLGFKGDPGNPGSCVELMACKDHPCYGEQVCEAHTDKDFVCRCDSDHRGLRCEVRVSSLASSSSSSTYIIAIFLVLLALVAVGGACYWYKKRPFTIWKGGSSNQSFRFVNPAFGVISDQAILNGSPAPSTNPSMSGNPPPYNLTNPHHPNITSSFENPFFKTDDSQINTSLDSAVASATDSTSIHVPIHKVDLTSPISPDGKKQTSPRTMTEFVFSPYNPVV